MPDIQTNTTNEVLAVKLDYIQKDLNAIKEDIRDIKNENITRREFNEALVVIRREAETENKILKDSLALVWKVIYSLAALFLIAIAQSIIKLVIK